MLLDTDIMVDFLRGKPRAIAWVTALKPPVGIPGLVALELIQGCRNLAEQRKVESILQQYPFHWPTLPDCLRAYQDFCTFHLSHNLGLIDSLIGATAAGLGAQLATFNVKHFGLVRNLVIVQPY